MVLTKPSPLHLFTLIFFNASPSCPFPHCSILPLTNFMDSGASSVRVLKKNCSSFSLQSFLLVTIQRNYTHLSIPNADHLDILLSIAIYILLILYSEPFWSKCGLQYATVWPPTKKEKRKHEKNEEQSWRLQETESASAIRVKSHFTGDTLHSISFSFVPVKSSESTGG